MHCLLDNGADINQISLEGMTPLLVCHLLTYPTGSLVYQLPGLQTVRPAIQQVLELCYTQNSHQVKVLQRDTSGKIVVPNNVIPLFEKEFSSDMKPRTACNSPVNSDPLTPSEEFQSWRSFSSLKLRMSEVFMFY